MVNWFCGDTVASRRMRCSGGVGLIVCAEDIGVEAVPRHVSSGAGRSDMVAGRFTAMSIPPRHRRVDQPDLAQRR